MITSNSRDQQLDSPTKEEANSTSDGQVTNRASSGSSAAPWLRLKDPRVVRVSRALGGKDRHSKVCTIRGLRDRRVRLSVPTAIQLYDLQDRLGFNQPSKVVDWLLNVAKSEIDELPPLPIPPGIFGLNQLPMVSSSHEAGTSHLNKEGFKLNKGVEWEELPRPNMWNSETSLRAKAKEVERDSFDGKENLMKRSGEDRQEGNEGNSAQVSTSSFLSRAGQSSSPGFVSNAVAYGSFFNLEPANFPMSHLGSHGFSSQTEDPHALNVVPLPSALSLSSGSQVLLCPPGSTQSYFPATSMEIDPRQINHFQMLASSTQNLFPNSLNPSPYSTSQSMRPFHFSVTPRLHSENEANKNQEFHAHD